MSITRRPTFSLVTRCFVIRSMRGRKDPGRHRESESQLATGPRQVANLRREESFK